MVRSIVCWLVFGASTFAIADDRTGALRPISQAESVLAVWQEGGPNVEPAIMLVVWPDGYIVWSLDRLNGGAPYRAGRIDPAKVTTTLARFGKDGLFDNKDLGQPHFGPDSQFISVLIRSGKKQVEMQSWHELFEASEKLVASHRGIGALEGRRRLDVLRESPADYLFFRFVWSETRAKVADLVPEEGRNTGKPIMKAGILYWQESSSP